MPHMCCEMQNKLSKTRVSPFGVYGINNKFTVPYTESRLFTFSRPFVSLLRVCSFSHRGTCQRNQMNGFSEYFTTSLKLK